MARDYEKARELIEQHRSSYPADVLGLLEKFVDPEEQFWLSPSVKARESIEVQQSDVEESLSKVKFDLEGFGDLYLTVRVLATSIN